MKKLAAFILIPILLLALVSVWWLVPSKMIRINPQEVLKIEIFNGNNGIEIVITERSEIEHIINNIKSFHLEKVKFRLVIWDTLLEQQFTNQMEAYIRLLSLTQKIQFEKIHFFIEIVQEALITNSSRICLKIILSEL